MSIDKTCGNGRYKNIKRSIGIIIFNNTLDKVLLVQKKHTYAFADFVIGKYDKNNIFSLIEKFNKMTIQEKLIISSLEFEWIWYNMFMSKDKSDMYCRSFGRFYKYFLSNPKFLKNLLSSSNKNGNLLWEPPKGRKNKTEMSISCAMREVQEETRIKPSSYQIISGKKIKKQIVSNNVRYIIIYYIAIMKDFEKIKFDINNKDQAIEISEVSWVPIINIQNYYMLHDLKTIIKSQCKEIKKERAGKRVMLNNI